VTCVFSPEQQFVVQANSDWDFGLLAIVVLRRFVTSVFLAEQQLLVQAKDSDWDLRLLAVLVLRRFVISTV
jgi:hypothetical protein